MSKQDRYTRSAKGKACTVRIPGVCKPAPNNETTVFAHLNCGGGTKHLNIHGAYACFECHQWLDGGYAKGSKYLGAEIETRDLLHLEAVIRTQIIMVSDGVLKL